MREGTNPQRHQKVAIRTYSHRIIIPLHIPNLEGYYKDSLDIFKLCLSSLFKTVGADSAITVVNNGSDKKVVAFINELYVEGKIDEVLHTQKVGKVNAIIKGINSCKEEYITITDADVLFKSGWLLATSSIFNAFTKAAVVGLVPQFKMYENFSYNVIFDCYFNNGLQYSSVKNPNDLQLFYKSLNWNDDYNKDYLKYNLSITKNDVCALVGTGHLVATYKRSVFDKNMKFTDFLLGGDSVVKTFDIPAAKKNLWRLNTEDNYAYHMGNRLEDWMREYLDNLEDLPNDKLQFPGDVKVYKNKPLHYFVKHHMFSKLFQKYLKKRFYKAKGLPANVAEKY